MEDPRYQRAWFLGPQGSEKGIEEDGSSYVDMRLLWQKKCRRSLEQKPSNMRIPSSKMF